MNPNADIKALFLDIGGVLLTNGWDRSMRRRAAETFRLDLADLDERHHLTFDTFEAGKLTLDEYLNRIVFFQDRPFAREDFKAFMFSQSQPHSEMIALVRALKAHYRLKIAVVSNEGRELTLHRIREFSLSEFVDFFVVSCFVHFRKPDEDIFRMALDLAQVPPDRVIYVEDRLMFIEVAQGLGIRGVHHTGYAPTKAALERFGLVLSSPPEK